MFLSCKCEAIVNVNVGQAVSHISFIISSVLLVCDEPFTNFFHFSNCEELLRCPWLFLRCWWEFILAYINSVPLALPPTFFLLYLFCIILHSPPRAVLMEWLRTFLFLLLITSINYCLLHLHLPYSIYYIKTNRSFEPKKECIHQYYSSPYVGSFEPTSGWPNVASESRFWKQWVFG